LRENWGGSQDDVDISLADLSTIVQPAFPGRTVDEAMMARGGLANTNIWLRVSGRDEPVLLRLFVRDPKQASKEVAINRTVAGVCPVPRFFHFATDNPVTGQPLILMEWIEGSRLEVAARELGPDAMAVLGRSIGAVLAGIHSVTFPEAGFLDDELRVSTPISVGSEGLLGFLRHCLVDGLGSLRIDPELTDAVMTFVENEGRLLDSWQGSPCLAHCDFNGSNILVREIAAGWEVAAVLDWEFAISGTPFFDLGNLIRPPLGQVPGFEDAVADGYRDGGGTLPNDWRRMSRLTDLTAWADFLNRPNASEALIRDATAMMIQTIDRT
jgi:aminoglycoside phosphotransferase (APT) family kinase protein